MRLWRPWVEEPGFPKGEDELPAVVESRKKGGEANVNDNPTKNAGASQSWDAPEIPAANATPRRDT